MKHRYIWLNFAVSVWLLLAFCALAFALNMQGADDLNQQYGPFAARVGLWPLAVGALEFTLWLHVYRRRDSGSRIMAGFVSVMLALSTLLVPLLVSDAYAHRDVNWPVWLFFLYICVSHLAYAVAGHGSR